MALRSWRRLTANPLTRSLAAMSGSTLVASLVGLLVAPFLTRLYSPDDFGVFSYIIADGRGAVHRRWTTS
ncbi:MAG: hypothetical protein V9E98_00065 [Candidatus Nanopelagicales bacterium]